MAENLMNPTIMQGQNILRPPYFDGTNYIEWKEYMKIFIQSVDFKLWLIITNGPNISKKVVGGIEVERSENEFGEEDMKSMEQDSRAKYILYCAVNLETFKRISKCKTAKQMWDELDREMTGVNVNSATPQPNHSTVNPREMASVDVNPITPQPNHSAPNPREMASVDANSATPQPNHSAVNPREMASVDMNLATSQPNHLATLQPNHSGANSNPDNCPILDFLEETREAMDDFLNLCVPLHKFALEGNWAEARLILDRDWRLKHAAIASGWPTVLHIVAGASASARHVHFVQELLQLLEGHHLFLNDYNGNNAFFFAAAAGNMPAVQLMLKKSPYLVQSRGKHGVTPIQFAALQGRCEMTWFLYDETRLDYDDSKLLFFTCINTGNYGLALKMADKIPELAFARDEYDETALHLLARNPLDSCCRGLEHQNPIMINPGMKQEEVLQLVNVLWSTILRNNHSKSEIFNIIRNPFQLLFVAAEVGNFGFLSELISAYPSLVWEKDDRGRSIIHIAVMHRHASIYNLMHEIGSQRNVIVTMLDSTDNTLLHLAAKIAPPGRLELVSGSAFQMCLELVWFKEVKKMMPPSLITLKNSEDLTASELFTREHAELRKDAESWMKSTAENCMLISTVIATGVFSAAISLPGGVDDNSGKPNYLRKPAFLIFAISDATALILSATSILIFLSILVSRYAEYDFYKSLPLKLIFGLITLFCSITSMMVAFGSAFFITYYYGLKWVPSFISVFACLPILLFLILQFSLWSDIMFSTYYCRNLFKPSKKMLYVLEK